MGPITYDAQAEAKPMQTTCLPTLQSVDTISYIAKMRKAENYFVILNVKQMDKQFLENTFPCLP